MRMSTARRRAVRRDSRAAARGSRPGRDPDRRRRDPGADRRAPRERGRAGQRAGGRWRSSAAASRSSAASPAAGPPRPASWSESRGSRTPATTASSCCSPGDSAPRLDPSLEGRETAAARLPRRARRPGARVERAPGRGQGPDPGACTGAAPPTRPPPRRRAREIAADAGRLGLETRPGAARCWSCGPPVGGGKDAAVAALLAGAGDADGVRAAIYAGDDRTDLDAFRRLRELAEQGRLDTAVCVGVGSEEGPVELPEEADLVVDAPAAWLAVLRTLAG